jgi:GNAT superfamily N-acetyltransferase
VIYNDAFAGHWGFTPIEKNEFKLLASDLKTVIDRKLVLIAELHEEAVAFLLCLPNYNEVFKEIKNGRLFPSGIFKLMAGKNKIKSVRVITVAVKKKYQHLGIGAALYPEILERAVKGKYTEGELSWVVDDNYEMNQVAKSLNASPYKTYSIYSKKL